MFMVIFILTIIFTPFGLFYDPMFTFVYICGQISKVYHILIYENSKHAKIAFVSVIIRV